MAFVALDHLINLSDGYRKVHIVNRQEVLLIQEGEERFVFQANCPHKHWPLSVARINNNIIVCDKHGAAFDLKTGNLVSDQCSIDCKQLRVYKVAYEGNQIGVDV